MVLKKFDYQDFQWVSGRVAVVVADFNKDITDAMLEGFEQVFQQYSDVSSKVYRVPGAFEIPLMVQRIAAKKMKINNNDVEGGFDVIVALGCVVKGDTYHFELVANECARGCMEVMLKCDIPVVFEVLAPYSYEDAVKRSQGEFNHGKLAAYVALDWLKKRKT